MLLSLQKRGTPEPQLPLLQISLTVQASPSSHCAVLKTKPHDPLMQAGSVQAFPSSPQPLGVQAAMLQVLGSPEHS